MKALSASSVSVAVTFEPFIRNRFGSRDIRCCLLSFSGNSYRNINTCSKPQGDKLTFQHMLYHLYHEISRQGAQWLSGRVLDLRPRGRGFEPHWRHYVAVLEQDTFILA